MKINSKSNESQDNMPNLYSLLLSNEKENFLEKFDSFNTNADDEFGENFQENENGNFFIMDSQIKKEREKRLNEKDKMYKIKKHYFLKRSYSELAEREMELTKLELIKEKVYMDNCYTAEEKLRQGKELNMNDIYYLFKRNFPLLNKNEKEGVKSLQNLHFAFKLTSATSSLILISYIRSIMVYFKFEIFGKKFLSFLFLSAYGLGIYLSIMHFVNISQIQKMKKFYLPAKDRILDPENEIYKTPYDEDEKTYNFAEKLKAENIFKF